MAGLGLRPGHEAGRAAYVGVPAPSACCSHGAAWRPWPTARSISQCHDGWKTHLVDAVAVAVVRRQLGLVPVGQHPVLAGLGGAGRGAERDEVVDDLGRRRAG